MARALWWTVCVVAAQNFADGAAAPTEVTTRNFDEVTRRQKDVFLVFYAPWCGHCRRLDPALQSLAASHHVAKCDGTEHRVLAQRFNVRGFPSLFLIKNRGDVYAYEGDRGVKAMDRFLTSGYRDARRLSLLKSPFGPVGRAKGLCIHLGLRAEDAHAVLAERVGEYPAYALVGLAALLLVILVVVVPVLVLA